LFWLVSQGSSVRVTAEAYNRFYAAPEGKLVQSLLSARVREAWPDVAGLDILGLGYTPPYLDQMSHARRVISAMPAAQGAEIWPRLSKNRCVLVEDEALPFPAGLFDRALLIHALESSTTPIALLCEVSRVLSPMGRVIVAVAARGGFWSLSENNPFGHGQPFSRTQLEQTLRQAELEPVAFSSTLYVPPVRALLGWAPSFEALGRHIMPFSGGILLVEAVRRPFVTNNRLVEKSLVEGLRQALGANPLPQAKTY
jgi:SAM-dependent methyltransferase